MDDRDNPYKVADRLITQEQVTVNAGVATRVASPLEETDLNGILTLTSLIEGPPITRLFYLFPPEGERNRVITIAISPAPAEEMEEMQRLLASLQLVDQ